MDVFKTSFITSIENVKNVSYLYSEFVLITTIIPFNLKLFGDKHCHCNKGWLYHISGHTHTYMWSTHFECLKMLPCSLCSHTVLIRCTVLCILGAWIGEFQCLLPNHTPKNWPVETIHSVSHRVKLANCQFVYLQGTSRTKPYTESIQLDIFVTRRNLIFIFNEPRQKSFWPGEAQTGLFSFRS